jgi:hypothetical protein
MRTPLLDYDSLESVSPTIAVNLPDPFWRARNQLPSCAVRRR